MKLTYLVVFLFAFQSLIAQKDGALVSREKVIPPPYQESASMARYYDSAVYTSAKNEKSVVIEKLVYYSDGLKVVAYLSTPAKSLKKKYPVIIFNRGSITRNDIGVVYTPMFKKFVNAGFIVLAPALRESEGGEGKDEVGGRDLNDIMNVVPLLSHLDRADTSKLFMLGESRGGFMTYMAMKENFPMKAVATFGAITDMEVFIKDTPDVENIFKQLYTDYSQQRVNVLERRSALKWSEAIQVPVLILNGQSDTLVKPYHALSLAQKLSEQGKPYELVIVEGGNHNLTGKDADRRDQLILDWFKRYL